MTGHDVMMADYYAAREAWELAAEAASNGFAEELAAYREQHPAPTLKAWLVDRRNS